MEVPVIVGLQTIYAVRVLAKLGVSIGLGQWRRSPDGRRHRDRLDENVTYPHQCFAQRILHQPCLIRITLLDRFTHARQRLHAVAGGETPVRP